jgi:hypothetical protein
LVIEALFQALLLVHIYGFFYTHRDIHHRNNGTFLLVVLLIFSIPFHCSHRYVGFGPPTLPITFEHMNLPPATAVLYFLAAIGFLYPSMVLLVLNLSLHSLFM